MRPIVRRVLAAVIAAAAAAVLCFATTALAQVTYTIIDLGTLGGSSSAGFAINNSGQVTGTATTSGGATHAFVISPPYTGMNDLGTLGGLTSTGFAINDSGQVTGEAEVAPSRVSQAFLISPPYNNMIDLGTLCGEVQSVGAGINASGQVSGTCFGPLAFVISPPYTSIVILATFGGNYGGGGGINASGQVTGEAATDTQAAHAFLSSPPTPT